MAVTLSARARFGHGGKQFVARVLGRDPKFTFRREFIGRKEGKRNESTDVQVDDAGLYEVRDIDSKGRAEDSYYIVAVSPEGKAGKVSISKDDAMKLARLLDGSTEMADMIGWDDDIKEPCFAVGGDLRKILADEAADRAKAELPAAVTAKEAAVAKIRAMMEAEGVSLEDLASIGVK